MKTTAAIQLQMKNENYASSIRQIQNHPEPI